MIGTLDGLWDLRVASSLQPPKAGTLSQIVTKKRILSTTRMALETDSSSLQMRMESGQHFGFILGDSKKRTQLYPAQMPDF